MFASVLLCVVALALAFLTFRWKRRRLYELMEKIPGPPCSGPLGNATLMKGSDAEIARFLIKLSDDYPGFCRLWLGPVVYCFLTKPEYIEIFVNSPYGFDKGHGYDFTKFFLGEGLGTAKTEPWRKHRKMISPSFSTKILNQYPDKINEQCNLLLDTLDKSDGRMIKICRPITNFSIDAFYVTIMGLPESNFQKDNSDVDNLFEDITRIVFMRICKVWYHIDWVFYNSKHVKGQLALNDRLNSVCDQYLEQRKQTLLTERANSHNEDLYKPFPDDMLMKNPKCEVSDQQLLDEFHTMFIAGTDTNANTISFILTALGIYKDVQQKVYDEVIQVLGPDREITLEDLSHFPYLERVIKETLRMIPALPNVGRVPTEEIDLGDYIVPKGVNVFIAIYNLHHNPQYWPEPFKYDPDRFLPENSKERHPYAWLPFSGGPRNCIGIKFGMMVMKMAVASVVRRFLIHSDYKELKDIELTINIVTKSVKPLMLSFTRRSGASHRTSTVSN